MRQTWDEQAENHGAILRHVKGEPDTGYAPYRELRMWRRRFWWAIALGVLLLAMWLFRIGGRP